MQVILALGPLASKLYDDAKVRLTEKMCFLGTSERNLNAKEGIQTLKCVVDTISDHKATKTFNPIVKGATHIIQHRLS